MRESKPPSTYTSRRIVDLLFGTFLTVLAIAIVAWAEPSYLARSIIAALLVGGVGIEAIISAARAKRSLLARIGPLP